MRPFLYALTLSLFGSSLISAPGGAPTEGSCSITVHVPVGATLYVNNVRTEQMTAVRRFVSPPLPIGQRFYYTFVASYTWNGEAVAKRSQVEVTANANVVVDMPAGETIALAAAKPEAAPRPFDKPKDEEPKWGAKKPAKPAKPEIEVPYVPTPEPVVTEMLKMAGVKEGDVVYDLGCGDGRIVIAAVKEFKAKKGLGIDFNPERVKDSIAAAKAAAIDSKKLEFREGDVLKLTEKDFEGVDVVTLYLLPEVNRKLKPVLKKGLKPGARVVSHDFDMGDDWKPEKTSTITDSDGVEHTVYLWTIPKK